MKIIRKTYMVQIENNKDSGLTFPKIWTSGGTIQKKKKPESNIQYVEGYRQTDNYMIENVCISVNENNYL